MVHQKYGTESKRKEEARRKKGREKPRTKQGWAGHGMAGGGLASGGRKFMLLLWKNWLLQKRNIKQTIAEVVLPIVFCVLLVVIRDLAPSDHYPDPTVFPEFTVEVMPPDLKPNDNSGIMDTISKVILGQTRRRRDDSSATDAFSNLQVRRKRQSLLDFFDWGDTEHWPVAYTPNTSVTRAVMSIVKDRLYPSIEPYVFASEAAMVHELIALPDVMPNTSLPTTALTGDDYLGGIVFMEGFEETNVTPLDVMYKIRLKGSLRKGKKQISLEPPPQWLTELVYPLFQVPGPRDKNMLTGAKPGYYEEGFLSLQHALDMAVAHYWSGSDPSVSVNMRRMPYPPYIDDKYLVALQAWLFLILLLSYLYPAVNIVKNVVYEKEKKLKESMKMMGLPNYLHWAAWFVKSLMFLVVTTLLITVLLCTRWHGTGSLAVLDNSDPSLVFFFFFVYMITIISYCFLFSTIFSKASSAATAMGLMWIFSYLPNEFIRPRYSSLTLGSRLLLCLYFNTGLGFGCQLMSMFEGTGSGIQWRLLFTSVSPDDQFTVGHIIVMMMLDTVIYSLLTWYIEAVRPGEFGVPQPWYFPFTRTYWLGLEFDSDTPAAAASLTAKLRPDPDFFEPDPQGQQIGIKVLGLTKMFKRGNKVAVNKMHLNMYKNQITVLLGHNGAGKTTTMSMLTGLFPPTSGTALVNGCDIVREMAAVRRSIGICPQHDVLFDELTVAEHIVFFSKLKGMAESLVSAEVKWVVEALKLEDKINAQSRTLSGGMKRKLSVGIALCAASQVVILDEPTSGMDPGARRLIWDLLQKEKQGRTLLLTTHFMEEADLLGDRIAIMALGVVQCCGSSMFLKRRYGAGYHLIIVKQEGCDVSAITKTIQLFIPDARLDQNHGAELSYVLPNENVSKFEKLFDELERNKDKLRISSYGASQTTMDEVFLRVGENAEQEEQLRLYTLQHPPSSTPAAASAPGSPTLVSSPWQPGHGRVGSSGTVASMRQALRREVEEAAARDIAARPERGRLLRQTPQDMEAGDPYQRDSRRSSCASSMVLRVLAAAASVSNLAGDGESSTRRVPLQRNTGVRLLLQQFRAMLVKKALYVLRNWVISLVQTVIPIVFLIMVMIILRAMPGINDSPPALVASFTPFRGTWTPVLEYNSSNQSTAVMAGIRELLTGQHVMVQPNIPHDSNMTQYLLAQAMEDLPSFNLHWMTSLEVDGHNSAKTNLTVMFNGKPYHIPPAALNLVDTAIVRAHTGNTAITLHTVNHPLPRTDTDKLTQDSRQNLGFQVGFNLAFGLSFLSGSLVMFLIKERSSNAKHLQFVSGVHFFTYWLATAIIDFCMYLVPFNLTLICLRVFNEEGLREPSQLGLILLVLMLHAWSMAPLMYLASFLFTVPSSGFTRMSMINIFAGMATLITVTILRIPDLNLKHVADILDWVFMLLPPYSMASSITDLYSNHRFTQICDSEAIRFACDLRLFSNPCCKGTDNCGKFGCVDWDPNVVAWQKLGIGRMIVFMGIEGAIFYAVIALIELKVFVSLRYFLSKMKRKILNVNRTFATGWSSELKSCEGELEEDVIKEKLRIQRSSLDNLYKTDILVFKDLTKRYGNNQLAVDHLNLGVPRGECFGLLGINGAGKTTTFKMLTGDIPVTSGDAYVNGYSITNDIKKVQQEVGYCPQFDAILDQMTGRETMRMFARLRGVPEALIDEHITDLAAQLIVTPHLDNLVGNYSGGNKRKLSTGIALIGEPPLVLLDEPTSGMDPVARRHLWDVLNAARDDGRSIILTSHSMEECEALCTRLAIMTNGRFRCLGSPQHLKNKFSEGYSLIVRVTVSESQETDHVDMEQLPPEMLKLQSFINSNFTDPIVREVQWGRMEYFIPASGVTWASVFGCMERNKEQLGVVDYSVTQTTLERVFLNFTREQASEE